MNRFYIVQTKTWAYLNYTVKKYFTDVIDQVEETNDSASSPILHIYNEPQPQSIFGTPSHGLATLSETTLSATHFHSSTDAIADHDGRTELD